MKSKFLSFGEIMLRLKAPGFDRLFQSPTLEATFGGGEANVALSLANFGIDAAYTTILPDNEIGTACLRELRKYGVDVSKIVRKPGRMGIYLPTSPEPASAPRTWSATTAPTQLSAT